MSRMAVSEVAPRAQLPRLLAGVRTDGSPVSLDEHLDAYGAPPVRQGVGLIDVVEASGLTGRGGAGFPTATKLRAVAAQRGRKFVVANGTEGEPLSRKDKALLGSVPHLVLDGAALAANAVGADDVIVAVGESAVHERAALSQALEERAHSGLDGVRFQIAAAPDGFVVGEETALLSWLSGREAKPTFVPPRPFERGLHGRPTLVQNVETLAQLALVRATGRTGSASSAPTRSRGRLSSRSRARSRSRGCTRSGSECACARSSTGQAARPSRSARISSAATSAPGSRRRTRSVRRCSGRRSPRSARRLAPARSSRCRRASAGSPRPRGSPATSRARAPGSVGRACTGSPRSPTVSNGWRAPSAADVPQIARWLEQVRGRGACRHPDGAVRLVASALEVFADEVDLHATGRCSGDGRLLLPTGIAG